jgi:hypothetical protein
MVQNAGSVLAVYTDEAVPVVAPTGTDNVVEVGAVPHLFVPTGVTPTCVTVNVTSPPLSAALVTFDTDTLMTSVVPTGTVELAGVTVTTGTGAACCVTVVEDDVAPVSASVAVTVHLLSTVPDVAEVYVVVITPLLLVVPDVGENVPQVSPVVVGVAVNITGSFGMGPPELFTVAVNTCVPPYVEMVVAVVGLSVTVAPANAG